jgi:hypothetical protein
MINAEPSLRAAKGLTGSAFATYLLQRDWSARPWRVKGISILSKDVTGSDQTVEFILPIGTGFTDEQLRIADALRSVATVEGRSVEAVAEDVRQHARTEKMIGNAIAPRLGEAPIGMPVREVSEIEIFDQDDGSLVVVRDETGDRHVLHTQVVKLGKHAKAK